MEHYFTGQEIYGDTFTLPEIQSWYEDEKEAYAELVAQYEQTYTYGYHHINIVHGFQYLPKQKFNQVLGLGSAYGYEFEPIQSAIANLVILEPSDHLKSNKIGNINVSYKKPNIDGHIDYPDDHFDLIVCFATLHHIPNVSYVLSELYRCVRKGGYVLIKEPIHSMGDWRLPRKGLTKRERGIPYPYFKQTFTNLGFTTVKESPHFTLTTVLTRKTRKLLRRPIYTYRAYVLFDKFVSQLFKWNISYHPTTRFKRIAPAEMMFVLTK